MWTISSSYTLKHLAVVFVGESSGEVLPIPDTRDFPISHATSFQFAVSTAVADVVPIAAVVDEP